MDDIRQGSDDLVESQLDGEDSRHSLGTHNLVDL